MLKKVLSTVQGRRKVYPLPTLAPDVFGQLGHLKYLTSLSAQLIPLLLDVNTSGVFSKLVVSYTLFSCPA